ncbi:MAG: helix-turn-helix domain-containing protein [Myxococcota bacterium]
MTAHDPDDHELNRAVRSSFGQVLLRAARLVDHRALAYIRDQPGAPDIRPAHTRLFPFIPFAGGIRATSIASELGVTKQAISPLVQDLVTWGLVEQVPDPGDGRARLLRWTARGRQHILTGLDVLGRVEAPWRAEVGEEVAATVHRALDVLVALLEQD